MELPKFLLGDNTDYPDAVFVIHTEYPRFIINLNNDEINWFDNLEQENKAEAVEFVQELIKDATSFFDRETQRFLNKD